MMTLVGRVGRPRGAQLHEEGGPSQGVCRLPPGAGPPVSGDQACRGGDPRWTALGWSSRSFKNCRPLTLRPQIPLPTSDTLLKGVMLIEFF